MIVEVFDQSGAKAKLAFSSNVAKSAFTDAVKTQTLSCDDGLRTTGRRVVLLGVRVAAIYQAKVTCAVHESCDSRTVN
jgi:hypothetical protein